MASRQAAWPRRFAAWLAFDTDCDGLLGPGPDSVRFSANLIQRGYVSQTQRCPSSDGSELDDPMDRVAGTDIQLVGPRTDRAPGQA